MRQREKLVKQGNDGGLPTERKPDLDRDELELDRLIQLHREWCELSQSARSSPETTREEIQTVYEVGCELMARGLDLVVPYMDHMNEGQRARIEQLMAELPPMYTKE